jgi:hypothetical protein
MHGSIMRRAHLITMEGSAGRGFDQVLATQRLKAAAQQGRIGQPVVQRHFAQAVAEPDVGCKSLRRQQATG